MEYQLQEEREAVRSGQSGTVVLREQVAAADERLGREMDLRQAAELQRREAELAARGNLVTSQQLQERLAETTAQLHAEREAKAVQVRTDYGNFKYSNTYEWSTRRNLVSLVSSELL